VGSSIGQVQVNGQKSGCGVLVGIDRLFIPAHIISGSCLSDLKVLFVREDNYYCYVYSFDVARFLIIDNQLDFCILQLAPNNDGTLPGNHIPIPAISYDQHRGEFLFARFDGDIPKVNVIPFGQACYDSYFCSVVQTEPGSSGSGCFDQNGRLFAIHLSRSTGLCDADVNERKALYLREVALKNVDAFKLLTLPICQPCCYLPGISQCAPKTNSNDRCHTNEGKPSINDTFVSHLGNCYRYWEYFPSNASGAGPRGITIASPRGKIVYKFQENPHSYKAYNKHQSELYLKAVQAYATLAERNANATSDFNFEAYGVIFHAIYQGTA